MTLRIYHGYIVGQSVGGEGESFVWGEDESNRQVADWVPGEKTMVLGAQHINIVLILVGHIQKLS